MNKIAIFLAVGFEEIEAVATIDILRRAGVDIELISVSGGEYVEGAHGIIVHCDKLFYNVDYDIYDMLILPGGQPGTKHLKAHDGLRELLIDFNKQNKKIAAICAAPSVLGELGILEGKEATCFAGFEKSLKGASISKDNALTSGNIITAKSAAYVGDFAREILKDMLSEKEIVKIFNGLKSIV